MVINNAGIVDQPTTVAELTHERLRRMFDVNVIGAMLVAPLMSAILGMGLSLVLGDPRFFWTSLGTALRFCKQAGRF